MTDTSVVTASSRVVEIAVSARSEVGAVRSVNEDDFLAAVPVFLVADGMGGHARGDWASRTVCEVFRREIPAGEATTPQRVLAALDLANAEVRASDAGGGLSGTTVAGVALVITAEDEGPHWMAFNIGDSRIYAWDGRRLSQLSVDHSIVQELIDAGELAAEDAARHPDRNVITRAIGADDAVECDVWLLPVAGAQSFVICSDGLSRELDDDAIARMLAQFGARAGAADRVAGEREGVADALALAAVRAGGRDNVTVVVVEAIVLGEQDGFDATTRDALHGVDLEDTRPRRS